MAKFNVLNRSTGQRKGWDLDKESISIGRLGENDIQLDSKLVSRKHAEIVRMGRDHFVVDLGSGNGTFVNGRRIKANEKTPLKSKDAIRIEEFEIEPLFETVEEESQEENTDSGIIEIKMIKKVLSAMETDKYPSLEVLDEPSAGQRVYFTDDLQELVIGRDADCSLSINSTTVSRRHAVLQKKWGGATIKDLQSKNGTFVNHQKVQEKLLKDGDTVAVGDIRLLFRNPQEIDLEALSRQYEKQEEPEDETEMEAVKEVSDGAKISVDPEEKKEPEGEPEAAPEQPDEPVEETPAAEPEAPPAPAKPSFRLPNIPLPNLDFLARFSNVELAMMGVGGFILIAAFIAILAILF